MFSAPGLQPCSSRVRCLVHLCAGNEDEDEDSIDMSMHGDETVDDYNVVEKLTSH